MSALHLDVFHAVVMMGGVTAASRHLNLSQPAVSRRLADLERALGFDLFIRDGKRLTITSEGKAFHEELAISFVGLEHLIKVAMDIRELRHGNLRFACMSAMNFGPVTRGIAAFSARHPDIKISHETYTASRIEDALTANLLDLAVGMLPKDSAGIETIASFRAACVCVMRPDHPLAAREVVRAGDLSGHSTVCVGPETEIGRQLVQLLEGIPDPAPLHITTQSSAAACALVEAGVGLSIVDPFTGEHFRRGGGVAMRRFEPDLVFQFHLMRPKRRLPSRPTSALVAELLSAITADPTVLS